METVGLYDRSRRLTKRCCDCVLRPLYSTIINIRIRICNCSLRPLNVRPSNFKRSCCGSKMQSLGCTTNRTDFLTTLADLTPKPSLNTCSCAKQGYLCTLLYRLRSAYRMGPETLHCDLGRGGLAAIDEKTLYQPWIISGWENPLYFTTCCRCIIIRLTYRRRTCSNRLRARSSRADWIHESCIRYTRKTNIDSWRSTKIQRKRRGS
jgi:hypothetical protein